MSWRTESTHARRANDNNHVRALDRAANRGSAPNTRKYVSCVKSSACSLPAK